MKASKNSGETNQSATRHGAGRRTVFDNFFSSQRPMFSLSEKVWNPPTDIYETCDSVILRMEVAGVMEEQLEVTVEEHLLVIRGCRREVAEVPKEAFHLMEIRYGHFERVFALPVRISPDDVTAKYSEGFLVVTVTKTQPAKNRRISIKIVEG